MAADLGTWPAEQATVLLEVLQGAGLHPEARRTRGEVHVTVPDEEGDRAHATLVANMDRVAQAARPGGPRGGRGAGNRRLRAIDGGAGGEAARRPRREPSRRRSSAPRDAGADRTSTVAALIAAGGFGTAVLAAASGAPPTLPLVAMTGALIWVLGRRAERGV